LRGAAPQGDGALQQWLFVLVAHGAGVVGGARGQSPPLGPGSLVTSLFSLSDQMYAEAPEGTASKTAVAPQWWAAWSSAA
jgi:hypothetical protein